LENAEPLHPAGCCSPAHSRSSYNHPSHAMPYRDQTKRSRTYLAYGPQSLTLRDYRTWSRSTLSRVRDWLPSDRHTPILDVGCGAGQFLYLMDSLGYTTITGVDQSHARVEQARRLVPRARVILGDLREVTASSPAHFGLITGFDVLEHFPKEEVFPLLTEMARALSPGGRVLIQTPNGESPWVGSVFFGDFTHEWIPTPKSLADLMTQAGLVNFDARECGPTVHGLKSVVRFLLWHLLKGLLLIFNLVETGQRGSGIYSRVFIATACRSPLDDGGDEKLLSPGSLGKEGVTRGYP
jgi:2-polyprenyl-3-methyl-5-hydroxy-6-metoxy-1,4-benzoquinol methylase